MSKSNLESVLASAMEEQGEHEKKIKEDQKRSVLEVKEQKAAKKQKTGEKRQKREAAIAKEREMGEKVLEVEGFLKKAQEKIVELVREKKDVSPALREVIKKMEEARKEAKDAVESVFGEVKSFDDDSEVVEAVTEEAYEEHDKRLTPKEKIANRVRDDVEHRGLDTLTFSPETARTDWEKIFAYWGNGEAVAVSLDIYNLDSVKDYYSVDSDKYRYDRRHEELYADFTKGKLPVKDKTKPYPFASPFERHYGLFRQEIIGADPEKKYGKGIFKADEYEAIKDGLVKDILGGMERLAKEDPELVEKMGQHYLKSTKRDIENKITTEAEKEEEQKKKREKINQAHGDAIIEDENRTARKKERVEEDKGMVDRKKKGEQELEKLEEELKVAEQKVHDAVHELVNFWKGDNGKVLRLSGDSDGEGENSKATNLLNSEINDLQVRLDIKKQSLEKVKQSFLKIGRGKIENEIGEITSQIEEKNKQIQTLRERYVGTRKKFDELQQAFVDEVGSYNKNFMALEFKQHDLYGSRVKEAKKTTDALQTLKKFPYVTPRSGNEERGKFYLSNLRQLLNDYDYKR